MHFRTAGTFWRFLSLNRNLEGFGRNILALMWPSKYTYSRRLISFEIKSVKIVWVVRPLDRQKKIPRSLETYTLQMHRATLAAGFQSKLAHSEILPTNLPRKVSSFSCRSVTRFKFDGGSKFERSHRKVKSSLCMHVINNCETVFIYLSVWTWC